MDMSPLQSNTPGKGKLGRRNHDLSIHGSLEPFTCFEVTTPGTVQAKLEWAHLHHSTVETLETARPCAKEKHRTEGKGAN